LQKAFSRERGMAGSEAIHVIEKVHETGLLRHFIPRKDADVIGAQWWRQDTAATGLLPPRYVRGRIISFLAKTGYGQ